MHQARVAPVQNQTATERTYVVVCRGPNCRERGSLGLRQRLAQLLRGRDDVGYAGYACFGQCERGPNVAFFPEGHWYGGLTQASDADHVVEHARGEAPMPGPPLELPEAERTEHLRNIADLVDTLEHDRHHAGRRHRWWPFG